MLHAFAKRYGVEKIWEKRKNQQQRQQKRTVVLCLCWIAVSVITTFLLAMKSTDEIICQFGYRLKVYINHVLVTIRSHYCKCCRFIYFFTFTHIHSKQTLRLCLYPLICQREMKMKTLGRYTIGLVYISAYLSISAQLGVINRRLGVIQLGQFI